MHILLPTPMSKVGAAALRFAAYFIIFFLRISAQVPPPESFGLPRKTQASDAHETRNSSEKKNKKTM